MADEFNLQKALSQWSADGGKTGDDHLDGDQKEGIKREIGKNWKENTGKRLLELAEGMEEPLPEGEIREVAIRLAPEMHMRWVQDRLAEGRSIWPRPHGFKTKEEYQAWLDNSVGTLTKLSSIQESRLSPALQEAYPQEEWWKYFDLLAFRHKEDFANLPPVWIGKNESAARENIAIVNNHLAKGPLTESSAEQMSKEVHENWILSNFGNKVGDWLVPFIDGTIYNYAKKAHGDWATAAYASEPVGAEKLSLLRSKALDAIDAFAGSIQISTEIPTAIRTRVTEVKDQLSSWDHMSFTEQVKDYKVILETVPLMALQNSFARIDSGRD